MGINQHIFIQPPRLSPLSLIFSNMVSTTTYYELYRLRLSPPHLHHIKPLLYTYGSSSGFAQTRVARFVFRGMIGMPPVVEQNKT